MKQATRSVEAIFRSLQLLAALSLFAAPAVLAQETTRFIGPLSGSTFALAPQVAPGFTGQEEAKYVPPSFKERAAPVYPPRAVRAILPARKEQSVTIRILVSEAGNLDKVVVIRGVSGGWGFDEAAVEAAVHSKYVAATRNGKPVSGTLDVAFVFKAQDVR
jgi:TonB family protein